MAKKSTDIELKEKELEEFEKLIGAFITEHNERIEAEKAINKIKKAKTRKKRSKPKYYLQLKISLNGVKPLVWRRVIVDPTLILMDMNEVIWSVMPWMGHHLHCFSNKFIYVSPPYEDDYIPSDPYNTDNYDDLIIGDFFEKEGDKCNYEYDFGDSWNHTVKLEKFVEPLKDRRAKFVTGRSMAPPDDCGGIMGYEELKEIMANPNHPEYKEMKEWIGMEEDENFDPKYLGFTPEEIKEINEEFIGL